MKPIKLRFKATCKKCQKPLSKGTHASHKKGDPIMNTKSFILCLACTPIECPVCGSDDHKRCSI